MKKKSTLLYLLILCGFLSGAVLGGLVPGLFSPISFLGDIYVKLLKVIVIPLLMSSIAQAAYRTAGQVRGRVLRVVGLFLVMFVISFLITAAAVSLIGPGRGVDLFGDEWSGDLASASLSSFFTAVIPDNIFTAMANASMLPCILFAFAFGLAAASLKSERTMAVCSELSDIFTKMLGGIMWYAPVGVFALIGNSVAQYGPEVYGVCAEYILLAWALTILVTVLVMMLPLWLFAGVAPVQYVKRVGRIWLITLSTCSSAATLPNTIRVCNEEFQVPEEITGIVVPLGCTIHMCGGAVSFCLLGLFTMQMAGIAVTPGLFLYMLVLATLINMAAPGIPGGGIVIGATYLTILGAPTGFIGLYSGIYRLLDMAYTTLNVTGDITANVLISESEKRRKK